MNPRDAHADALGLPRTESLAVTAYQQIRRELDEFHFMPGDRFTENGMSARLGMSRTPVREALFRLQQEGYISVVPKLGWLVNAIDFSVFEQLYDVRSVLECAALDAIARQDDPEAALSGLRRIWCVPQPERLADLTQVSQLDEAFHMALVALGGNAEMARIHREITERIRVVRRLEFTRNYRITAAYDEHVQILELLQKRDTEAAKAFLRTHIAISREEVKKITLHTLQAARQGRGDGWPLS
ncbi:GntR family transcriptional regulator [Diaphorobacter sp. JS3051]|jgi:DNA-binding GntR family transcriptional regulator|uniref:GntR family transcriptional regulator n=1 Tax=Diaphorobacter sp. JS3051 TaxID=2792224 RepID=UPI0018C9DC4E|nr:GntR family transcriptional regulator [Diaphorobacter sp. JS3051]QPN29750.1 GntR family transcriptional regulator [Diaphorobacter sp. JS3051]